MKALIGLFAIVGTVIVLMSSLVVIPATLPILLFGSGAPQVLSPTSSAIGPVVPDAVIQSTVRPGQSLGGRPSQFGLGLNPVDAYAACGPAAAIGFARWWGQNPPITLVMQMAIQDGLWDARNGMHGVASEQRLLTDLRLPTKLELPVNWPNVVTEAAQGRPVILDTPGHYYIVDAWRRSDGALHVGTSGTDLRGGSDWMTPGQINGMAVSAGAVRAAIYASTTPPPPPEAPGRPA